MVKFKRKVLLQKSTSVVSSFTYLGIMLPNSGIFHLACKEIINICSYNMSGAVKSLFVSTKAYFWE